VIAICHDECHPEHTHWHKKVRVGKVVYPEILTGKGPGARIA
jgi:hypothetical protein